MNELSEFAKAIQSVRDKQRAKAAIALECTSKEVILGWKIIRSNGTTGSYKKSRPYDWTFPAIKEAVLHTANRPIIENKGACPSRPGDGFCAVISSGSRNEIVDVTSGNTQMARCRGLVLGFQETDILGANYSIEEEMRKIRLARVAVIEEFSPLEIIKLGLVDDLYGANLRNSRLPGSNFNNVNVNYVTFNGSNLRRADFSRIYGKSIDRTYFTGANLEGANFSELQINNCNFEKAKLSGTDFRGANFENVTFSPLALDGALTEGITIDKRTGMSVSRLDYFVDKIPSSRAPSSIKLLV